MAEAKDTFIIRTEWYEAIQELKPADQLTIYNNLFLFHKGMIEDMKLTSLGVKLVWKLIEPTLKSNIEKYDKRKETSAANGALGGRPRKNAEMPQNLPLEENLNNLNKPIGFENNLNNLNEKPNNLTQKPNNLNNPDSVFDSVSVSVYDSVSDNDNDNDNVTELKNKKEKKVKYRNNVALLVSEHMKLQNEFGADFIGRVYDFFADYKTEKGYKTKDDNLTIRRWVINAVREKEMKTKLPISSAANMKLQEKLESAKNRPITANDQW